MNKCKTYLFSDDGSIPNNPDSPLLLYPKALSEDQTNRSIALQLLSNNGWTNGWVNGIFDYHHYHSTTHEVLAVISGSARVKLGGEEGRELSIEEADVILIPAGVGHCQLSSTNDFRVVGAYAGGRSYDLCRGVPDERPWVIENIKDVPMPDLDPVTGQKDPLHHYWNQ